MSDIETLRELFLRLTDDDAYRVPSRDEAREALAALERVESSFNDLKKDHNYIFDEFCRMKNERDTLRAKLEKAKEVVCPVMSLIEELCDAVDNSGGDIGGSRGSLTILREIGPAWCKARAVLAELSAENEVPAAYVPEELDITNHETVFSTEPAVITHDLSTVVEWLNAKGYTSESMACLKAMGLIGKLLKPPQISDEAVKVALIRQHNELCDYKTEETAMHAAILAALEVEKSK